MFVVPGQRPRTVAIAPQAGTEAPIGLIKKDSTNESFITSIDLSFWLGLAHRARPRLHNTTTGHLRSSFSRNPLPCPIAHSKVSCVTIFSLKGETDSEHTDTRATENRHRDRKVAAARLLGLKPLLITFDSDFDKVWSALTDPLASTLLLQGSSVDGLQSRPTQ